MDIETIKRKAREYYHKGKLKEEEAKRLKRESEELLREAKRLYGLISFPRGGGPQSLCEISESRQGKEMALLQPFKKRSETA